ncbi:MAG: hypothetical protein HUJ71_02890 [Pseudobutyrivibrio sp.]|nr:hypothetical protein [Pseudobutyrivibrio sp.]
MTLKEMYDILLELAEPYKQSPLFEKVEEPIADDSDEKMSVKIWFQNQIITLICDREGFVETKYRKRKLTMEEHEAINGHQMTLDELTTPAKTIIPESEPAKAAESEPVPTSKPDAASDDIPTESEEMPINTEKMPSKPRKKGEFRVGDRVKLVYGTDKLYSIEAVIDNTARCKVIGQVDTFCAALSDLELVE